MNRTLCDVLEAMRKANETRNFSYLLGLIEEAQDMGNRMEAKLYNQKDEERLKERLSELKKEIKDARAELKEVKNEDAS